MIQAANTASRTDDRLKKYYKKIAKRYGHHVAITCSKQDDQDNVVNANIQNNFTKKGNRNSMRENLRGSNSNIKTDASLYRNDG